MSADSSVEVGDRDGAGTHNRVLPLPEYEIASNEFFSSAIDALVVANNPLLAGISRERVDVLPPSVNTISEFTTVESTPALISGEVMISIEQAITGDLSGLYLALISTAEQFAEQLHSQMFTTISNLTEATGNVVSARELSTPEALLEALERIEITFDEDGKPNLPTLVMHPDTAAKLGEPPEDYEERVSEIMERKRNEWMARRRTRRLPRRSH